MQKQVNDIHWHDCEIESVVEIPSRDMLAFNVQYPVDWENNVLRPKALFLKAVPCKRWMESLLRVIQ